MRIVDRPFRELLARKSKYGFSAHVGVHSVVAIGQAVAAVRVIDPSVVVAINASGGSATLTIHSNSDDAAVLVREYVDTNPHP